MDDVNKTIPHLGALRGGNCLGSPLSGGPEGGTGIPPRRGVLTHRCTVFFLGLGMKMPPGAAAITAVALRRFHPVDCYLLGLRMKMPPGAALFLASK